jgi:hypothetical protein
MRSGATEGFSYSLSRWTDVPASKWAWFVDRLNRGSMPGFDPTTGVPTLWSLAPQDVLGLQFWTKDPSNLIASAELLKPYPVKIHVTMTGWHEVELGAPRLARAGELLLETAKKFGRENVEWRFSPVPLVDDVLVRFRSALWWAKMAELDHVFISFLQTNDRLPETRHPVKRKELIFRMAEEAQRHGIAIRLCNEDKLYRQHPDAETHPNFSYGVCAPVDEFPTRAEQQPKGEGCGCALTVDAFSINESCRFGCSYCYASDKSLSITKRNTVRLPQL